MFTHLNKLGDFELEANTIDGVRYYTLPSGQKAPSITSITSFIIVKLLLNGEKKLVRRKPIRSQKLLLIEELSFMIWLKNIF